jgi:two-component system sensor histidine kinase QseC
VEDSGPGIPESEYSRVLDRFYRIGGDQHSSNIPGSGLGLSIVSFIVQLYKGQIIFSQSSTLGGLAIEVSFPSNNKSEHNE